MGNGSTYSPDDDAGVEVRAPGAGNEIYLNEIRDTLGGVDVLEAPQGLKIYGNAISRTSSVSLGSGRDQFDVEIFDNLLCDSNNNFRMQDMDLGARRVYFYRNCLYNGHAEGDNNYFHWSVPGSTPTELPEIWVYHNTFVGSCWGMTISNWAEGNTAAARTYFVNNVYSPTPSRPLFGYVPTSFGVFDHNWAGGQHPSPLPAWFGPHNVLAEGQELWPDESVPDFRLPEGCSARSAGLDLSRPFVLGGTLHLPLPGMAPGYFGGSAPDLGALQTSVAPPPIPIDSLGRRVLAYPNPAREEVRFAWASDPPERVRIDIFNVAGERIAALDLDRPGGPARWLTGETAPGLYFYRVTLTVQGVEHRLPAGKLVLLGR